MARLPVGGDDVHGRPDGVMVFSTKLDSSVPSGISGTVGAAAAPSGRLSQIVRRSGLA
jgi:hypothetical protein